MREALGKRPATEAQNGFRMQINDEGRRERSQCATQKLRSSVESASKQLWALVYSRLSMSMQVHNGVWNRPGLTGLRRPPRKKFCHNILPFA